MDAGIQTLEIEDDWGKRTVDFIPTPEESWVGFAMEEAEREDDMRENLPLQDEQEVMNILLARYASPEEQGMIRATFAEPSLLPERPPKIPIEFSRSALSSMAAGEEFELYLSRVNFGFKEGVSDILKKVSRDDSGLGSVPPQLSQGVKAFGRKAFHNCAKKVVAIAFPNEADIGRRYQHFVDYVRGEMAETLARVYSIKGLLEYNPFIEDPNLTKNTLDTMCNNAARRCLSTIVSSLGPKRSMKDRRDTLRYLPHPKKRTGLWRTAKR